MAWIPERYNVDLTNKGLACLGQLSKLKKLEISTAKTPSSSDDALACLRDLNNLEFLFIGNERHLKDKYDIGDTRMLYLNDLINLRTLFIASPRILMPFLELHQNADRSVTVPQVLRPYMGGKDEIVAGS